MYGDVFEPVVRKTLRVWSTINIYVFKNVDENKFVNKKPICTYLKYVILKQLYYSNYNSNRKINFIFVYFEFSIKVKKKVKKNVAHIGTL